ISNSALANLSIGNAGYGRSNEVIISNSNVDNVAYQGALEKDVNLKYSMSGGRITIPSNRRVTGATDNGSGLIRLAVDSTVGYTTGKETTITIGTGSQACAGTWVITVVDPTHVDLQGSAFGGTCAGGMGSTPLSWAIPGTNVSWSGRFYTQGPAF